jgi:hypothetical protein
MLMQAAEPLPRRGRDRTGFPVRPVADLEQQPSPSSSTGSDRRTLVVGLLADPDTPAEIAAKLVDDLPDVLGAQVDSGIVWDLRPPPVQKHGPEWWYPHRRHLVGENPCPCPS